MKLNFHDPDTQAVGAGLIIILVLVALVLIANWLGPMTALILFVGLVGVFIGYEWRASRG